MEERLIAQKKKKNKIKKKKKTQNFKNQRKTFKNGKYFQENFEKIQKGKKDLHDWIG